MINMVETILKERQSCIKIDEGFSDRFTIGRSTPQGDRASPYIFVLCVEVLLMKLSYEAGKNISMCNYMTEWSHRIGLESGLAEGYADDITVMFKYTEENLQYILATLDLFHLTSGLSVNLNKTQLMVCGTDRVRTNSIILGVTVVEKIKVLGVEIDRKVENLDNNWRKIIHKIQNITVHWSALRLSIAGRVGIVKTFLLSQCIYLMNCIPMSRHIGSEINDILVNYVKGGDRAMAMNRAFNKIELGGYGIIDTIILNTAIKASWIKRWATENVGRDYAGYLTLSGDVGNVENIGIIGNKILSDIVENWHTFLKEYYMFNENWLAAKAFGNTVVLSGIMCYGEQLVWEMVFDINQYGYILHEKGDVKIGDLLDENLHVKQKMALEQVLGLNFSHAVFFRLRGALNSIVQYYRQGNHGIGHLTINEWLNRVKKGSGKFREFLDGKKSRKYGNYKVVEIPAAITLWGQQARLENEQLIRVQYATWGVSQLNADIKNFMFRLVNGKLYLNNVLAHIDNVDPKCTFCKIELNREFNIEGNVIGGQDYMFELNRLPNETVEHIFYDCRWVNPTITEFCRQTLGLQNLTWGYYILGREETGYEKTMIKILVLHCIKYYIYQCRAKKTLPNVNMLNFEFSCFIKTLQRKKSLAPYCRNVIQLFN
jgi:hypothetical protein